MIRRILLPCILFFTFNTLAQTEVVLQSGHTLRITAMAYSNNGKYVATGSADNSIILWDFASGMQIRSFQGHSKGIGCIAFSNDSKLLVSGSYDQTLKVWDVESGKCTNTIPGFGYGFTEVSFSYDGRFLAATNRDKSFNLWRLDKPTPEYHYFTSDANYGDMAGVTFDTLGNVFFATWDRTIYHKNLNNDSDFSEYAHFRLPDTLGDLNAIHATVDGKKLVIGCAGYNEKKGQFLIVDVTSAKIEYSKEDYYVPIGNNQQCISVTGDGRHAAYITDEGKVNVFYIGGQRVIQQFEIPDVGVLQFSKGGKFLSISSGNTFTEYNIVIGSAIHQYKGYTTSVKSIVKHTDDKITSVHQNALMLWDLDKLQPTALAERIMGNISSTPVINYDRTKLAYEKDEKIYIYDLAREVNVRVFGNFKQTPSVYTFSNDGKFLAACDQRLFLFDMKTSEKKLLGQELEEGFYDQLYFSPDSKYLFTYAFSGDGFNIINTDDRGIRFIPYSCNNMGPFAASKKYVAAIIKDRLNGEQSAFLNDVQNSYETGEKRSVEDKDFLKSTASLDQAKYVVVWDIETGKIVKALKLPPNEKDSYTETPDITAIVFDSTGEKLVIGSTDNLIRIWDMNTGKIIHQMSGHHAEISTIMYSHNGRYLISSSYDGSIIIWDAETYEMLSTAYLIGNEEYIIVTPENYYACSKNGTSALAFRKGFTMYPFALFDARYNRPDKVLERLKCTDTERIRAFYNAYKKRLQKEGLKEDSLVEEALIPQLKVENIYSIPLNASKPYVTLNLSASDNHSKIIAINISVNDVPQCYNPLLDPKKEKVNYVEKEAEVKLMNGRNRIVVSCTNENGSESLPVEVEVNYNDSLRGNVYFIGIAVAGYKDEAYNLTYSVKDIRDLAGLFASKYPNLKVDTLFNKNATRSNILMLKQKLQQLHVNDVVIMAISGHGLLSKNLDFYYATWDVNFKKPEENGIKYEDIEALLDCIAPRKKLLMLDACHSGEVDRDGNMKVTDVLPEGVKENRSKGAQLLQDSTNLSLSNSFELMKEIFASLSKGNGSIVISAAGGKEFAYESDRWKNGVFTYCVYKGLQEGKADLNNDKAITISELKKYVSAEVEKLTMGRQKPTSRRENLIFDWRIWE